MKTLQILLCTFSLPTVLAEHVQHIVFYLCNPKNEKYLAFAFLYHLAIILMMKFKENVRIFEMGGKEFAVSADCDMILLCECVWEVLLFLLGIYVRGIKNDV